MEQEKNKKKNEESCTALKKGKLCGRSETEEPILQYLGGKEEQDSTMSLMTGHTDQNLKEKKKKKEKHISCHVPEKPKLTFHQTDKILQIHASIVCTIQSETAVDLLTLTLS